MTATRAEYTEALTPSNQAYADFTAHLGTCPSCRPVRLDCPTRNELYSTASRLDQSVEDIVTGWAQARRSAAAPNDETRTPHLPAQDAETDTRTGDRA